MFFGTDIGSVCRKKVSGDYEALDDRLKTLPDQLSYDIMVRGDIKIGMKKILNYIETRLYICYLFFLFTPFT